jgi:Ca2+-binding EF-hand superfamily protein
MKLLKLSLAAAAVAGLAVAGVSWSQMAEHQHPGDWKFPIVIADAEARGAEIFARTDTDDNEEISSAEFAAAEMPRDHARHGARRHAGHRGKGAGPHGHGDHAARSADRDAFEAELFAALDSNGDGQLSAEEFAHDRQREARRSLMKARAFAHLDADADGVLRRDEFPGRLARLKDLDADGNGEVSRDELRDGIRAPHHRAG